MLRIVYLKIVFVLSMFYCKKIKNVFSEKYPSMPQPDNHSSFSSTPFPRISSHFYLSDNLNILIF